MNLGRVCAREGVGGGGGGGACGGSAGTAHELCHVLRPTPPPSHACRDTHPLGGGLAFPRSRHGCWLESVACWSRGLAHFHKQSGMSETEAPPGGDPYGSEEEEDDEEEHIPTSAGRPPPPPVPGSELLGTSCCCQSRLLCCCCWWGRGWGGVAFRCCCSCCVQLPWSYSVTDWPLEGCAPGLRAAIILGQLDVLWRLLGLLRRPGLSLVLARAHAVDWDDHVLHVSL